MYGVVILNNEPPIYMQMLRKNSDNVARLDTYL